MRMRVSKEGDNEDNDGADGEDDINDNGCLFSSYNCTDRGEGILALGNSPRKACYLRKTYLFLDQTNVDEKLYENKEGIRIRQFFNLLDYFNP